MRAAPPPHRPGLCLCRADSGFSGAEKSLIICIALAAIILVGTLVRSGGEQAARDAERVLRDRGPQSPLRDTIAPMRALGIASAGAARGAGNLPTRTPAPAAPANAVEEAPVTKVLDVSWQGQQRYYWCGPASTRLALSTRLTNLPDQATLASSLRTTENGTDHVGLVTNALNQHLGTTWFQTKIMNDPPTQEQRDLLKRDVVLNISKGYPLVANVVSGWRPPGYPGGMIYHYVTVVGYDQSGDRVLIADPAGECAGGASWCAVPRTYWVSVWDLGTWIGGKGYSA